MQWWVAVYLHLQRSSLGDPESQSLAAQGRFLHTAAAFKRDQQGRKEQGPFPGCIQGDASQTLESR